MLTEPTMEKLRAIKLGALEKAWEEQRASAASSRLSFDERFGLLVDAEWLTREIKRLSRNLKEAQPALVGGVHRRNWRADAIEVFASVADGWQRPAGYAGSIESVRIVRQGKV